MIKLRPAFSRQATFEWFVLLLWGVLLSTQPPAVTSYLNALGQGRRLLCSGAPLVPLERLQH